MLALQPALLLAALLAEPAASSPVPVPGGDAWLDLLGEVVMALALPVLGLVVLWMFVERLAALLARLATLLLGERDAVVAQVRTGREGMIGQAGVARTALAPRGKVFIRGELWDAEAEAEPVAPGEGVEVIDMEGLTLRVRPRRDNDDKAVPGSSAGDAA